MHVVHGHRFLFSLSLGLSDDNVPFRFFSLVRARIVPNSSYTQALVCPDLRAKGCLTIQGATELGSCPISAEHLGASGWARQQGKSTKVIEKRGRKKRYMEGNEEDRRRRR